MKMKIKSHFNEMAENKLKLADTVYNEQLIRIPGAWDDSAFLSEMKSRIEEFESGADQGRDWTEIFDEVKSTYAAKGLSN